MFTQVMSDIVDKLIEAVRDLVDAVMPKPQPVLVPIPVRSREPRIERRPR